MSRVQNFNVNIIFIRFHTVNIKISYTRTIFNFDPTQFFQNTQCTLLVHRIVRNSYGCTVFNIVQRSMFYRIKTLRSTRYISYAYHICIDFFVNSLHISRTLEYTGVNRAFFHRRIHLHVLREGFYINGISFFLQNRLNRLTELFLVGSNTKSYSNLLLIPRILCCLITASRQHCQNTDQHH
ncbi:hypothetical protein D1872_231540 [compost metagenome]